MASEAGVDRHDEDHLARGCLRVRPGFGLGVCLGFGTHVGALGCVWVGENVPEDVYRGVGLDCDAGEHVVIVDVADQLSGGRLLVGGFLGLLGGRGKCGFVVEAVQVATDLLELLYPLLGLSAIPRLG